MEDEVGHVRPGSGEVTWGREDILGDPEEGLGSQEAIIRERDYPEEQPTMEYIPKRMSKEEDEEDPKRRSSSKKKEKQRLERERSSSKKKEKERLERERSSSKRKEKERLEKERLERENSERERKERETLPVRATKKRRKMPKSNMSSLGRCLYGFIIFVVSLSLVMTAIVHIFAWYENDIERLASFAPDKIDWFKQLREEKWDQTTCIMETRWTFWIWIAMFFLQLVWIFYGMVLTCRRTKDVYLYESAATMPCTLYLTFLLSLGATALWNVFWGESGEIGAEHSKFGAIVIGGAGFLYHVTLAIAVRAFIASIPDLVAMGKKYDLLWNQLFTQNGLAGMATWCTMVTMYAITSILRERNFMNDVNFECAIGLGLIMFYMLVWFMFDIFFTKKALYYIFMPYIVVLVTFIGALVRNMANYKGKVEENLSFILSACFLSVTALFVVIKVITVIVRGRYRTGDKDDTRSLHDDNVYVMQ